MASDAATIQKHLKHYWIVFCSLGILTVVTVGASYLETSVEIGIVIALLIASFKGSLVAAIFMHLVYDKKSVLGMILILTAFFFIILLLLPVLTEGDSLGSPYVP